MVNIFTYRPEQVNGMTYVILFSVRPSRNPFFEELSCNLGISVTEGSDLDLRICVTTCEYKNNCSVCSQGDMTSQNLHFVSNKHCRLFDIIVQNSFNQLVSVGCTIQSLYFVVKNCSVKTARVQRSSFLLKL